MKFLPKVALIIYVATLLWLVLFKFSFDITGVLSDYQAASLNLVPFFDLQSSLKEVMYNFSILIPFGLLLSAALKRFGFWQKLGIIFMFSFVVEILQFVLAIGRTDITDIIANTLGGLVGLAMYTIASRHIDNQKLDRYIAIVSLILLISLIVIRSVFLQAKYSSVN